MKLLTGNSNKVLSKNIAKYLKSKLVNSVLENLLMERFIWNKWKYKR